MRQGIDHPLAATQDRCTVFPSADRDGTRYLDSRDGVHANLRHQTHQRRLAAWSFVVEIWIIPPIMVTAFAARRPSTVRRRPQRANTLRRTPGSPRQSEGIATFSGGPCAPLGRCATALERLEWEVAVYIGARAWSQQEAHADGQATRPRSRARITANRSGGAATRCTGAPAWR